MFNLGRGHVQESPAGLEGDHRLPTPDRCVAADAITDNGMRLAELGPPRKDRLQEAAARLFCGMNPVDYTFSQDVETVKETIEIGVDSEDMGSCIVVLKAEFLEKPSSP